MSFPLTSISAKTWRQLVRFENEPTALEQRSIKVLGYLIVSFRRISHAQVRRFRYHSCHMNWWSRRFSRFSSPGSCVRNPDPQVSICSLCQPIFQSPDLSFLSTSLGINGSGCPPGSALYTLSSKFLLHLIARSSLIFFSDSADKSAVTVIFSKYFPQAGPGISISDNHKNCQMTLGLRRTMIC